MDNETTIKLHSRTLADDRVKVRALCGIFTTLRRLKLNTINPTDSLFKIEDYVWKLSK